MIKSQSAGALGGVFAAGKYFLCVSFLKTPQGANGERIVN
jgi:hypothetical protein